MSVQNKKQLLVPPGFAHGFLVLSESADVLYKCDKLYQPDADSGIIFNDPALEIDWKLDTNQLVFSAKDIKYPSLANAILS